MLWLLLACAEVPGDTAPETPSSSEEPADCGDWASVGQPFALSYCTGCHSPHLEDRFGAPASVDLLSLEDLRTHRERTAARIQDGTMPPGGGPSPHELQAVLRWLECGAPGEEGFLPGAGEGLRQGEAGIGFSEVSVEPDFPEGLTVRHEVGFGELLLIERFLVSGPEAWLVGWEDQRVSVEYDPPLLIWSTRSSWTTESSVRIDEPDGGWTEEQVWTATLHPGLTDGRDLDPDALTVLLVNERGEEHSFSASPDYGLVGRRLEDRSGSWWLQQNTGALPGDHGAGFPVRDEQVWLQKLLWMEPL